MANTPRLTRTIGPQPRRVPKPAGFCVLAMKLTPTAEWGLALTRAGTAVCRAERKRRNRPSEIDTMVAARGRAHADLLLSPSCFPAIAAAAWCSPVELNELWYFTTDALSIERWRLDELTREAIIWVAETFSARPPGIPMAFEGALAV